MVNEDTSDDVYLHLRCQRDQATQPPDPDWWDGLGGCGALHLPQVDNNQKVL